MHTLGANFRFLLNHIKIAKIPAMFRTVDCLRDTTESDWHNGRKETPPESDCKQWDCSSDVYSALHHTNLGSGERENFRACRGVRHVRQNSKSSSARPHGRHISVCVGVWCCCCMRQCLVLGHFLSRLVETFTYVQRSCLTWAPLIHFSQLTVYVGWIINLEVSCIFFYVMHIDSNTGTALLLCIVLCITRNWA